MEYLQLAAKRHRNHKSSEAAPQTEDLKTEDRRPENLTFLRILRIFAAKNILQANQELISKIFEQEATEGDKMRDRRAAL